VAERTSREGGLKVLVVDDHAIVREGLADMLRDAGYVVFEASDGERAVATASSVQPDLVIMDVLMPGMSGIDATERIVARDPAARVVMLSVADSAETVRAAVRAGAVGYLTKAAASRASLIDALSRASAGERVFTPPGLLDALVHDSAQLPPYQAPLLTAREKEIITLAAQGTANSAIAVALGLSPRTVENHLARIYKKLGITSRTQLARMAVDQQIERYPWTGQTCTIMFADIAAFSAPARSARDQVALRNALSEILREAFTRSGIPWSASQLEDRGDGALIIVPPGVPTSTLIDPCLTALARSLRTYNRTAIEPVDMQLRIALDAGLITSDALGVSGDAVIRASRLVDAPAFREKMRASGADLGVIVSESVYDAVIRLGNLSLGPTDLQSTVIHVKDWETTAWMWFSGPAPSSGSPPASRVGAQYGRGAALRLVEDLLAHAEGAHAAESEARWDPVMVFEGPRGIGKTSLLMALAERFGHQVPLSIIDCENFNGDERALLSVLAFDLAAQRHRRGTLRFPRLITAQIAMSMSLETADRAQARDHIRQLFERYQRSGAELRDQVARDLAAGLAKAPTSWRTGFAADLAGKRGAELVLGKLPATSRGRRVLLGEGLEWYGHRDLGLRHDPLDALVDLNRTAIRPPTDETKRDVAEVLWAAFLADLTHSNGRQGNYVLLLDNADTPAGRGLLGGLLDARRLSGTGKPDPLTVIAARRAGLPMQFHGEERAALADASYADSLRRGRRHSAPWLYQVSLPSLTRDETEQMVAALHLPVSSHRPVTDMVHRFAAGHPATTQVLLSAIAEHPDKSLDLRALLDQPGPGHHTVEETMLSRFLQGLPPEAGYDIVTCSAALHREDALRMAIRSGLLTHDSPAFSEELWLPGTIDGHAVIHPALRRLLLRRLSKRDDSVPASWSHVHELLSDESHRTGNEIDAMYYALALGDVQYVASWLTRSLDDVDASEWLRLLDSVTAAPNRLDHRQPIQQQLTALTQWTESGARLLAPVARLVAASWIRSDPLSASHHRVLYQLMAQSLHAIAACRPENNDIVFYEQGNQYRRAADSH
jgi:DNA-binding NarL/FixJ family response regulator